MTAGFVKPLKLWRFMISRQQRLLIVGAGALVLFCLVAALRLFAASMFDFPIIMGLNAFAHRSQILDHAMRALAAFDLFQGLPVVALAYGCAAAATDRGRLRVAIGILGAGAAAILSRLLQTLLPSLPRPTVDPALPFRQPYGGSPESFHFWNSFPSDHVTLLWGMAIAILTVNWRIGAVAILVAIPSTIARLYCGLHYPTDVLGGVLLGGAVGCVCLGAAAHQEERLLAFAGRRPVLVATVAFLVAAQAGTFFYDLRAIGAATMSNLKEIRAADNVER